MPKLDNDNIGKLLPAKLPTTLHKEGPKNWRAGQDFVKEGTRLGPLNGPLVLKSEVSFLFVLVEK